MTQHTIFLSEQQSDKIKQLKMIYKLKSVNDVVKFLLNEYQIRIEDKGFLKRNKK